jgi:hypothetical protein
VTPAPFRGRTVTRARLRRWIMAEHDLPYRTARAWADRPLSDWRAAGIAVRTDEGWRIAE